MSTHRASNLMPVRRIVTIVVCVYSMLSVGLDVGAQPTRVERGAGFSLTLNGEPFFPIGWNAVGTCTSTKTPDIFSTNRDSAAAHLDKLRDYGVNTIIEPSFADGRIVARAQRSDWYNWYQYAGFKGDSHYAAGHPRPGAYVEGLLWLMDEAMSDGRRPIYSIISLSNYIKPGYDRRSGHEYGADDVLSCQAYASVIARERELVSDAVPRVACSSAPASLPFWEWNLWYIVTSLRDHPGLLGWYLIDEPEGVSFRHMFGIVEPDEPVRRYDGSHSLPTPDLLRYVYGRVSEFEMMGRGDGYARHPIIVDIAETNVFFSNRYSWSTDGSLNPQYSSGPFDRTPDGGYHVPADVLGLEGSGNMVHTRAAGDLPEHPWYWDQNFITRDADMLMDVVRRDSVWAVISVASQAQLPSEGPFAIPEPLRCEPNDQLRTRVLNDRDLVWQLLAQAALGVRGHLYYSHALMPATGPGAEQVRRSNRLLAQFRGASLDKVLMAHRYDEWAIERLDLHAISNYFRSDPSFVGSAESMTLQASHVSIEMEPSQYRVRRFGRAARPGSYGEPAIDPPSTTHAEHELLHVAMHRFEEDDYLFVANSYDARLDISVPIGPAYEIIEEGVFNLSRDDGFLWREAFEFSTSPTVESSLRISLQPYESKVFRLVGSDED